MKIRMALNRYNMFLVIQNERIPHLLRACEFMKKNNNLPNHDIPDIDIMDLENDDNSNADTLISDTDAYGEGDQTQPHKGYRKFLNLHVALVAVFVVVVVVCAFRLKNWGVKVDLDEIFKDGPGTYEDTLDQIVPLLDADAQIVDSDVSTIVAFGNAPFADDRDSEDNLANLIADLTGTTVYNCSVADSYMVNEQWIYDHTLSPMDAYSFYFLSLLATGGDMGDIYTRAEDTLKLLNKYPEGADYAYETLTTLDFNTVDAIVIMYDATDYYMAHNIFNGEYRTDITSFAGALEAGIEAFQNTYPHIRIIVLSPTYAFAVNENGDYVSSDQYTYGTQDVLSTYSIKQCAACVFRNVTFVDNLYGTITEDNAKKYLEDHVHLNVKGRQLVAERFEYALNYYKNGYGRDK